MDLFNKERLCQFAFISSRICNLNCPFCITNSSSGIKPEEELSVKQWIELIDLLKENFLNIERVKITGGEPLHPLVIDRTITIASMFSDLMIPVRINTNGTYKCNFNFINPECISWQVSIDGNKEKHDKIRGNGVFDKAINFIKEKKEGNEQVYILSVLTEYDDRSIEDILNIAKELDVRVCFRAMQRSGRGKIMAKNLYPNLQYLKNNVDYVIDKFGLNVLDGVKDGINDKCIGSYCNKNGGNNISIDEKGNFIHCPSLCEYKFGNAFEVLKNNNFDNTMLRIKNEIVDKGITCHNNE